MSFISYVPYQKASHELERSYRMCWDDSTGGVDHILRIHSHNPQSMVDHYQYYRNLMKGRSPLTRPQREMLAVVVSALNRCHY